MVHIDEAVKLDFKDVLIRPKRSTLKSRSQVRREGGEGGEVRSEGGREGVRE